MIENSRVLTREFRDRGQSLQFGLSGNDLLVTGSDPAADPAVLVIGQTLRTLTEADYQSFQLDCRGNNYAERNSHSPRAMKCRSQKKGLPAETRVDSIGAPATCQLLGQDQVDIRRCLTPFRRTRSCRI